MTEHDAFEIAYNNGKEYMRQQIINNLRNAKGNAVGVQRQVLADVIEIIKKLDVRP